MPGQSGFQPIAAGWKREVAIDVDADDPRFPAGDAFQQVGEIAVAQRPPVMPDVVFAGANEHDPAARLISGPSHPERVVNHQLHRLQPALRADQNNGHGYQIRTE